MFYRENGQFKTTYQADQQILPIRQDRLAMLAILVLAFVVVPALAELRARFERANGHRLVNRSNEAGGPRGFLDRGRGFDIALLPAPLVQEFAPRGTFAPGGVTPLLRAPVAIAVRSGMPKPDIATPQALRTRLLLAKAFTYTQGGEAGPHIDKIIAELGLTEAVRGKAKALPTVRQAIQAVASGEAELFLGLTSVIAPAYGIELVGPLPPPLGHDFVIAAAIGANADRKSTRLNSSH